MAALRARHRAIRRAGPRAGRRADDGNRPGHRARRTPRPRRAARARPAPDARAPANLAIVRARRRERPVRAARPADVGALWVDTGYGLPPETIWFMGGVMGRGTILGALAVLGLALAPGIARAAEFAVDSPTDAVDADVGDGKCVSVAENGGCTLRAAVQEADAAGAASTIVIPPGRYKLTIAAVPEAGSAADRDA